jgi:hypothetical protein
MGLASNRGQAADGPWQIGQGHMSENLDHHRVSARTHGYGQGMPPTGTTAEDVARWMLDELERDRRLTQLDAVLGIARRFGPAFLYENRNGRPAIDKRVLKAFRILLRRG